MKFTLGHCSSSGLLDSSIVRSVAGCHRCDISWLLTRRRGRTIGCPCVLANAAIAMGEASVLIAEPIDMKNLLEWSLSAWAAEPRLGSDGPECGSRTQHILSQSAHHSSRPWTVADDVHTPYPRRAVSESSCFMAEGGKPTKDEADDQPNSCYSNVRRSFLTFNAT